MSYSQEFSEPPELTESGVLKLVRAYDVGTRRIRDHFVNVMNAPGDPQKLKEMVK